MALTVAQIITLACVQAKVPGFTAYAGQKLNLILQELAQSYQLATAQGWLTGEFVIDSESGGNNANVVLGSGPYPMPSDFLRMDNNDFFWQLGGINYFPIALDIQEFDNLVQQPGFSSYPTAYSIDTSTSPPGLYIWPASSGDYQYFGRYHRQQPDISSPQTSSAVPWFPNQMYLDRRLFGEMCLIAGDDRADWAMKSAADILSKYLDLEGNNSTRAATVTLDRRRFGPRWTSLPPSKAVPW